MGDGIKDSERIEALRRRLYERGQVPPPRENHQLTNPEREVPRVWPRSDISRPTPPSPPISPSVEVTETAQSTTPVIMPTRSKRYRLKILALGGIFFVLSILVSIVFMTWGNQGISGENITLAVTGPFTIGGGEAIPIQVGLTNQNAVPIESATLIVDYPRGTLSATEDRRELFSERLPLDGVQPNETLNIPLRALVFGEENEEQEIKVSVEYRVAGSNAHFVKTAEPLRYKITSSPVTVKAETLKKISSGQETTVTLTITSNSQNPMTDVLVQAEYPQGFSYTKADPAPTGGQNSWLIKKLDPEQSTTITITGVVVGNVADEHVMHFAVGIPDERDPRTLASVFTTTSTQFEIEQPFLDIALKIAGVTNGTAVVKPIERSSVSIEITNTLPDTINDIVAVVKLTGNAISDLEVGPPNGFYDSATKQITWDISSAPELESLAPGEKARLTFSIAPAGDTTKNPMIDVSVDIKARRISESQVAETLTGTAKGEMRVASEPILRNFITHNTGTFSDTGPVPPKAEQPTTYTATFLIDNGTNDVAGGTVTATLPSYVTWTNQTAGAGTFSYDAPKRLVTWNVGRVNSQATANGSFQISITPSKSQLGTNPVLVGEQQFRADDQFTSTVVRDTNPELTTEMSTETGHPKGNGRVTE